MARISSRTSWTCALVAGGFLFAASSVRAGTQSEDGGAGVFRLQSAALPEETAFGFGLYNRLTNIDGAYRVFNSLIKGNTVTDTFGVAHPTHLWTLDHVLSASFSTQGIFEAHVALPMYTELLSYNSQNVKAFSPGDLRYGFKLALPIDDNRFPLAVALLLGGSLPTAELGAPIPRRLEYFPADTGSTAKSHAVGTRRDDWNVGAAATLDLEQSPLDLPIQFHFNSGVRKTSAIMTRDLDFNDIFSVGTGFEGRFSEYASLVGEYWHENNIDTTTTRLGRVDDISLGIVFHTPIDISILVGGAVGLANGESSKFKFYDGSGSHQYDANIRSSSSAQAILAVTYTHRGKPKDSDHDGVPDRMDKCPHEAQGIGGHDGCPSRDRDGDGIPDNMDKCPDEPQGVLGQDGCPVPDRDGDGVLDSLDKCPDQSQGLNGHDGCPFVDSDNDGVPDDEDKCPNEPGSVANNGCPAIAPPPPLPVQQKTLILKGVSFETGKALLLSASYPALDDIAAQLISVPEVELEVAGHTDNRGSEAINLKLSKARAQAVADYLTRKGVAAGRLKVAGYGFTKPIASNNTAEGRSQNRRVEFNRLK